MEEGLILFGIFAVVVGVFTGQLAQAKGYKFGVWFLLGFLFNLISLLTMVGMPMEKDNLDPTRRRKTV